MLAPAMIPVEAGKNTEKTEKNDSPPVKWGTRLNFATSTETMYHIQIIHYTYGGR